METLKVLLKELRAISEQLSDFKTLRKIPRRVRRNVRKHWDYQCAICRHKKSQGGILSLGTAHIIPVEEGGESKEENLLPLCERREKNLVKAGGIFDWVGCHHLLDNEVFWPRNEIRRIKENGPCRRPTIKRPEKDKDPIKEPDGLTFELKQVEFLISMRRTGQAYRKLKELKEKYKNPPDAILKLTVNQLRCERRRKRENRQDSEKILKELDILCRLAEQESSISDRTLNLVEYETGMIFFAKGDFEEASEWLRRYKNHPRNRTADCYINEAQACISDFEYLRKTNLSPRRAICALTLVIPKLDKTALENPQIPILSTWRVTARLHLARMKAHADKNGESLVEEAEKIRNEQNKETGWKSYTSIIILHAKGECYRANQRYEKAIKTLSLATRKILVEKCKNYEYLDNVLEGLLKVPSGYNNYLDQWRKRIGEIRDHLKQGLS